MSKNSGYKILDLENKINIEIGNLLIDLCAEIDEQLRRENISEEFFFDLRRRFYHVTDIHHIRMKYKI